MVTVSVTGPFPVPEAGDNVNQAALSLAFQLKVPSPVLLMRQGLGCRIGSCLSCEGEACGTRSNGGRHGSCGDGKCYGDNDRRSPGGAEHHCATIAPCRQGSGRYAHRHGRQFQFPRLD